MRNIRNKPMILVWPVDEQKPKKKDTNVLMGDSYMYCVSERDLFPSALCLESCGVLRWSLTRV